MQNTHTRLIKKTSFAFFLSSLIASPASAMCPSGYLSIKSYDAYQVGLKWADEPGNNFSRCLNTEAPEKNNVRDSYGINYRSYPYQCGNIKIDSVYLGDTSYLSVKTADPSVPSIHFQLDISSVYYGEPREWCEQERNEATCYRESKAGKIFLPDYTYKGINKKIYFLGIARRITECRLVSF